MERVRLAVVAALLSGLVLGSGPAASTAILPAAAVAWPPSTGLLLSEVQTGGASASDEFIELTNASASSLDLLGLEVVYVTSTGSTITRKASWAATRLLDPGRHLLIANVSGTYAGLADATYSGGLAATGGAIALRVIGGTPIDAIGWGDATNAFVEGSAPAAPAAGSSLERLPGGSRGNTLDTNANASDWFVQASPNPQNLASPPVPAPGPSPTPVPTPTIAPSTSPTASASPSPIPTDTATPSDSPQPSATEAPTPVPTATPSVTPIPTPEPSATPTPTSEATASPEPSPTIEPSPQPTSEPTATPAPPTPEPTPVPTATATPTASPAPTASPTPSATDSPPPSASPTPNPIVPIASARGLADGATATIMGVLTTQLGALDSGRTGFVQDDTAGIALYLDAATADGLPAGTLVVASGTLDQRYAERVLRVTLAGIQAIGGTNLPDALSVDTGAIDETLEGLRVHVIGITVGSPSPLADGLGLLVDDGTGSVRAIIGADALAGLAVPAGTSVEVTGPVGQHDSSGTGAGSYRILATLPGELVILPEPTPSPTPTPTSSPSATPSPTPAATSSAAPSPTVWAGPTPTPAPTASPTPTPTPTATPTPTPRPSATPNPTPTPSPSPTPSPTAIPIAQARATAVGVTVTVQGVVTAEAGRLGTPALFAIADGSAGIVVRLPDGMAAPGRGTLIRATGVLADPYGQLEIRPATSGLHVIGSGVVPSPGAVSAAGLGEATEARLVTIVGLTKVAPTKGTSGDLTFDFLDGSGTAFRVAVDASSGIKATDVPKNQALRLVGVVGQHASRKGALDGYRIWLRDRADVTLVAGGGPSPSSSAGASASAISISAALALVDGTPAAIEGTVTVGTALLDSSGRRIVVQDASGAIEVLLPSGARGPAVGSRVRVTGVRAHAWDAPRIKASVVTSLPSTGGGAIAPAARATALAAKDEWRLVRMSGTVLSVHRIGERWTAELRLPNGDRVPLIGQAGSAIPSTVLANGQTASIVGIAKRPYPTATDRRFALLPRSRADLSLSGGSSGGGATAGGGTSAASGAANGPAASLNPGADVTPDTDLATLFEHIGETVRVGGLIQELDADGFLLDDGTAVARVVLSGDAAPLLVDLRAGEAISARGLVRQDDEALSIVVSDGADLERVGDLGEGVPIGSTMPASSAESGAAQPEALGVGEGTGLLPEEVSLVTLAALTVMSVVVTLLRRRASARRSRALVLARISALGRPRPPVGPPA